MKDKIFNKNPLSNIFNRILKKIFDIFFTLLFIALFWWLYLIIGIAIKFSNEGPIIFKQKRRGKNEKIFYCYKFRTMEYTLKEPTDITTINDQRVFYLGKFLRKYNLDELPQFFNVLKGDMSLVGPRPFMVIESDRLMDSIEEYKLRYVVLPGITGYSAIQGYRGGTKDISLMKKRISLDLSYIENWSILLDIKICFLTISETIFGTIKGH